jgi:hypothetical protein
LLPGTSFIIIVNGSARHEGIPIVDWPQES